MIMAANQNRIRLPQAVFHYRSHSEEVAWKANKRSVRDSALSRFFELVTGTPGRQRRALGDAQPHDREQARVVDGAVEHPGVVDLIRRLVIALLLVLFLARAA